MPLLNRLLAHDAWTTLRVLDSAAALADVQLDQDFDIGHRTVRETLDHMIGNIETWTDLMAERPVRRSPAGRQSIADFRQRFTAAMDDFSRLARDLRDAGRLDDHYLDVLDQPPQAKTFGGTILHVITHNHMHRAEILHMLERLGLPNLVEGDVLGWEAANR